MKRTIATAVVIFIFTGLNCCQVIADRAKSSGDTTLIKKATAVAKESRCATTAYSTILMVWRNPATGQWESKTVDEPAVKAVNATVTP